MTGCFATTERKVKDLNKRGIEVERGRILRVFRF